MKLYVIAASEDGPSKVGISSHPEGRLRALKTGNPLPLSLYYAEHVGVAAPMVERLMHLALAPKQCAGVNEWFDLRPEEARLIIQAAAAAVPILVNDNANLHDLSIHCQENWLRLYEVYRERCVERGECDPDELEKLQPSGPLQIIAMTVKSPHLKCFNFNHYLLTLESGMWLRWAFERLDKSMPSGNHLRPYLEADRFLEGQQAQSAGRVAEHWIEWSAGRELLPHELHALASIWNKFVPLYNAIQFRGPQWETHGIDDHVDDVHLFVLKGDIDRGDRDCVVFFHKNFRAVLIPNRRVTFCFYDRSIFGELVKLPENSLTGFIAPTIAAEIWQQPFIPWLQNAPRHRDNALSQFLDNPAKRYPIQRPYDGPQHAAIVCVDLPRIDEYGMY